MKKSIILVLLWVIGITAFAQVQTSPQWTKVLSDQPETFRTQLVSSSENSIKVNVQVPGFYTTNVTTPRGEAKIISMPKAVSTAQAGEPNVPMTGIPAIIGDRARMNIRVLDAQYMDFEGIEVAPSKGDFPRTIDPATVPYTYGECYSQDAFFPANNVGLYEPYIVRDFRGQNMVVYPYAYNPVTKTLRVYYNMTVEMYKVDDHGTNVMETRRSNVIKMDQDFKSVYQRHFINYEASMNRYTPVDEEGDLLIICYDNFMSEMTDFVNWKKTRGVNTTIVGTTTAGSSYTAIKNYIQSQYNTNNNLTHVLLVGDVAQIPGYSYSGGGSSYSGLGDNAYGQIVGSDYYNDVFIGRFSAQTAAQVTTQVNRVITYERDLTTSATWLQKADGIARNEGGSGHNGEDDYEHMDVIRTDLLNYGYNTVYQDYENLDGFTGTASSISSHINSGVGIVNYCNHGNTQLWGVASYSNVQVNALTNSNKLPFIWSVACLVGKYDNTSTSYGGGTTIGQTNDCFAEAWMHATYSSSDLTPTGAIGALMSYISQPWIPPMWAQDECVDILAGLSNSGGTKHTWGGVSINGLFGIFDNYGTDQSAVGTYQAWILYGDPSMLIRTKTPQAMTVTHSGNLPLGSSTYSVSVTNGNGAVATITDADHNILGKATVSNGSATISISGSLTANQQLTLCVFGFDKVTYLGTITVIATGEQYTISANVNPTAAGSVSGAGTYYENSNCTLTATANSGYGFTNWTQNGSQVSTNPSYTFTVTGNATYTANFHQLQQHHITYTAQQSHGTIGVSQTEAYMGDVITLTATPDPGYSIDHWTVTADGETISVENSQFTMPDSDVTVSATFKSEPLTVADGTGTNSEIPFYGLYADDNYQHTQTIYPSSMLTNMQGCQITKLTYYLSSSVTKSFGSTFQVRLGTTNNSAFSSGTVNYISISGAAVYSGTLSVSGTTVEFDFSDNPYLYSGGNLVVDVRITALGSGYQSMSFYGESGSTYYSVKSRSTSSLPTTSGTGASFMPKTTFTYMPASNDPVAITVSANPTNGGTVTGAGTYDPGTTATLTATASEGYTFTNWTKNGVVMSTNATYSFTVSTAADYVANFTINSYNITATAVPAEGGTITVGARNRDDLVYDFENGWQNWTTFQGNTTSPNSWMHNTEYVGYTSQGQINLSSAGNNSSSGFMLSESYISATYSGGTPYGAVTPDNYLVSPQIRLGGSITFYAAARMSNYPAEKFSVLVSESGNSSASDFTHTLLTVTLTSSTYNWNAYTVDLSDYSGMGYVAIRHYDCYDQHLLYIDDVTIVEGQDPSTGSGNFNYGETCVVTATPLGDYHFVNWTENGNVVSTSASYTFTVTADRDLVANFALTTTQSVSLVQGWNWWTPTVEVSLGELEAGLGTHGIIIKTQTENVTYEDDEWMGDEITLTPGQMYKIKVDADCSFTLSGIPASGVTVTINPGSNWFGYTGLQAMSIADALNGFTPAEGDVIKTGTANTTFEEGEWMGDFDNLQPGQGYIYVSRDTVQKTITFLGN